MWELFTARLMYQPDLNRVFRSHLLLFSASSLGNADFSVGRSALFVGVVLSARGAAGIGALPASEGTLVTLVMVAVVGVGHMASLPLGVLDKLMGTIFV